MQLQVVIWHAAHTFSWSVVACIRCSLLKHRYATFACGGHCRGPHCQEELIAACSPFVHPESGFYPVQWMLLMNPCWPTSDLPGPSLASAMWSSERTVLSCQPTWNLLVSLASLRSECLASPSLRSSSESWLLSWHLASLSMGVPRQISAQHACPSCRRAIVIRCPNLTGGPGNVQVDDQLLSSLPAHSALLTS